MRLVLQRPSPASQPWHFSRIAKEHEVVIIVPLYEKAPDGKYYNSAVVIDTDGTTGTPYHKVHIPQDPGFFEKGYFYPGNAYQVVSTQFGRIAVLICYDQWFPEAARCVALEGAEIIFYPTAIGHPTGDIPAEGNWQDAWELIQRSHAIANSVHVAAVNRVGTGGALLILWRFLCLRCVREDPCKGHVTARRYLIAPVDLSMNRDVRESWGFFRNRRPDTYGTVAVPFPGESGAFPGHSRRATPRGTGGSICRPNGNPTRRSGSRGPITR